MLAAVTPKWRALFATAIYTGHAQGRAVRAAQVGRRLRRAGSSRSAARTTATRRRAAAPKRCRSTASCSSYLSRQSHVALGARIPGSGRQDAPEGDAARVPSAGRCAGRASSPATFTSVGARDAAPGADRGREPAALPEVQLQAFGGWPGPEHPVPPSPPSCRRPDYADQRQASRKPAADRVGRIGIIRGFEEREEFAFGAVAPPCHAEGRRS